MRARSDQNRTLRRRSARLVDLRQTEKQTTRTKIRTGRAGGEVNHHVSPLVSIADHTSAISKEPSLTEQLKEAKRHLRETEKQLRVEQTIGEARREGYALVEGEKRELEDTLGELEGKLGELEGKLGELEDKLGELQGENDELKGGRADADVELELKVKDLLLDGAGCLKCQIAKSDIYILPACGHIFCCICLRSHFQTTLSKYRQRIDANYRLPPTTYEDVRYLVDVQSDPEKTKQVRAQYDNARRQQHPAYHCLLCHEVVRGWVPGGKPVRLQAMGKMIQIATSLGGGPPPPVEVEVENRYMDCWNAFWLNPMLFARFLPELDGVRIRVYAESRLEVVSCD
ncbi:hypothetical protein JAAARDRAFT_51872 [Jaapia argillacea MUCL 33604]|uniref:RING-type domain-containing protein n=1 Tax=Jaapia argillacea MUCL 33604 TaxID=933084 RepID=A0A067P307_9AGAM|nr:hypothetical protein JAAARDRAFT_51872 [Jaapia argillacea MUCL 33604]